MLLIHLVSHHVRRLMPPDPTLPLSLVSAEILSLRITEFIEIPAVAYLRYVSAFQDVQSEPKRPL